MNSKALTRVSNLCQEEYNAIIQFTEYRGIGLRDMLTHLSSIPVWRKEFKKFLKTNSVLLKARDYDAELLEPVWYVSRLFAGGAPSFFQVEQIYKRA